MIKTIAEIENSFSCRYCKYPLESNQYRFCDSNCCQALYALIVERKVSMRHTFNPSMIDPFICNTCKRELKAHGKSASCETCDKVTTCDLIDNMLLCVMCEERHLASRKELAEQISIPAASEISDAQKLAAEMFDITQPTQASIEQLTRDSQELLNKARAIDVSMRYSGDFFNAETIALTDMKRAIDGNSLIPSEHKGKEYQLAIMQRIIHFQEVIFKTDSEKFEALQRIAAGKTSLREYGNDILKEVRETIAKNDSTYVVSTKPVKPKVASKSKSKKDPYEMLVESLMNMHNCSRGEALKMMVDNDLLKKKV